MLGYILRRMVSAFLVVVLTSMFVFALFFLGPTNAAAVLCSQNERCTPDKLENIEEALGFNDGVVTQYAVFAKGLFVDREINVGSAVYPCDAPCLGISYVTKEEVTKQLMDKYPATLSLAIGAAALYLFLGVTIGVFAAKYRGTIADRGLVSGSLLLSSIPYYLFALLAWIFLTLHWSIFPTTGYFPITEDPLKWLSGMLLPWLVLGVAQSTIYARFSRGAMVETLGEDYVRTATAKGLSPNKVIFKHGLRAAIVPVVTIFGLDFAALLAGTIFTERIFDIDGIGRWGLDAIPVDFPVISAVVLVTAVLVVVGNLVVDILYGFLDPRVRLV